MSFGNFYENGYGFVVHNLQTKISGKLLLYLYLDFWKPGQQKYQVILLLGNLKQQNSFKGRLKAFIWRRAVR